MHIEFNKYINNTETIENVGNFFKGAYNTVANVFKSKPSE